MRGGMLTHEPISLERRLLVFMVELNLLIDNFSLSLTHDSVTNASCIYSKYSYFFFQPKKPLQLCKSYNICMVVHVQNYCENEIIMISYYSSVINVHLS